VAAADEREIQHATDAGALVIVVPTIDTVEEAIEARNWTYFPPLGRRSNGGGQAFGQTCMAACRAATATRSTTTSC
jgi:2-keto-3-deoxy-L-rhamnonate aldolase RhmA